jgi:hypothetical protein
MTGRQVVGQVGAVERDPLSTVVTDPRLDGVVAARDGKSHRRPAR